MCLWNRFSRIHLHSSCTIYPPRWVICVSVSFCKLQNELLFLREVPTWRIQKANSWKSFHVIFTRIGFHAKKMNVNNINHNEVDESEMLKTATIGRQYLPKTYFFTWFCEIINVFSVFNVLHCLSLFVYLFVCESLWILLLWKKFKTVWGLHDR